MKRIETQILKCLLESEKSIWELLNENFSLVKDFVDTINKMFSEGTISVKDGRIYLTGKGLERIDRRTLEFKSGRCSKCEGKRITFAGRFEEVAKKFSEIVKDRPQPDVNFFQGYMCERDVIARVALMHYYNDLADKSIVLIGDDDHIILAEIVKSWFYRRYGYRLEQILIPPKRMGVYLTKAAKLIQNVIATICLRPEDEIAVDSLLEDLERSIEYPIDYHQVGHMIQYLKRTGLISFEWRQGMIRREKPLKEYVVKHLMASDLWPKISQDWYKISMIIKEKYGRVNQEYHELLLMLSHRYQS
ncbi:MAG: bis-aminopropyl spermidine synthase family protein [Candidatus Bathyarchaeia archaeon]